ncbi:MAG: hypothetical protein ACI8Y4_001840 [Candidatus Poriferisodalaceae bacterium]|jgi:hypothetical protein
MMPMQPVSPVQMLSPSGSASGGNGNFAERLRTANDTRSNSSRGEERRSPQPKGSAAAADEVDATHEPTDDVSQEVDAQQTDSPPVDSAQSHSRIALVDPELGRSLGFIDSNPTLVDDSTEASSGDSNEAAPVRTSAVASRESAERTQQPPSANSTTPALVGPALVGEEPAGPGERGEVTRGSTGASEQTDSTTSSELVSGADGTVLGNVAQQLMYDTADMAADEATSNLSSEVDATPSGFGVTSGTATTRGSEAVERVAEMSNINRIIDELQSLPAQRSLALQIAELPGVRVRLAMDLDGTVRAALVGNADDDAAAGVVREIDQLLRERLGDSGSDSRRRHDATADARVNNEIESFLRRVNGPGSQDPSALTTSPVDIRRGLLL